MIALLIMGPTASGKSALALALAERLNGVIVNADSMQVYADLRVLTARPGPADEARAPHRLYGFVDAAERFSVGHWLGRARAAITEIADEGRTPILVGGTGLYFKALTEGLTGPPPADDDTRARLRQRLEREGSGALHDELASLDPTVGAALGRNDAPRILRALETYYVTGRTLSSWRAEAPDPLARAAWRGLCLVPDRAALYGAIDARFATMVEEGAVDEARALAARGLDPALPCMKAHGAPHLFAHLRGEMSLPAAIARACQDTRNYAKRQFTWMRGQMPDWPRAAPGEGLRLALALTANA